MGEQRRTLCNRDCPDACGVIATVEGGRVIRLAADRSHPITGRALCYRTQNFLHRQYSSERLLKPLYRPSKGAALMPLPWEDALDLAAERLRVIRDVHGPASIFHYQSGGSLGLLKVLSGRFFSYFGPVTVKSGDICSGAGERAQVLDFGISDSSDLSTLCESKNIFLWGKNVAVSSPHTIPMLRAAQARGAHVVQIDPVYHESVKLCDSYVQVKPGGDFALAMGIAAIMLERGWVSERGRAQCDHFAQFAAMVQTRPASMWCSQADVEPTAAAQLAERLAVEGPTAILIGWGLGRRRCGMATVRALDALCAISGNLGVRGGGASFTVPRRRGIDLSWAQAPNAPPPRTISEPMMGEQLGTADPPIRGVWVTAGNPVAMLPDSVRVANALSGCDFVVVVDSFLTDTAAVADLVLPTTTLLEDDDLIASYGHHYIGVSEPVVEPPAGVLSDLQIMQALASRLGFAEVMHGDARTWKCRLLGGELGRAGVDLQTLRRGVVRNPLAPEVLFEGGAVPTPSGRVQLIHELPDAAQIDAERAGATGQAKGPPARGCDEAGELGDGAAFPLKLMALSVRQAQSSQWVRVREDGLLEVAVHPRARGGVPVADGAQAFVESRHGRMRVRVRYDARQRRDVLVTAKGGSLRAGRSANALIRGELTDGGEGAVLYDEAVRLLPADPIRRPNEDTGPSRDTFFGGREA